MRIVLLLLVAATGPAWAQLEPKEADFVVKAFHFSDGRTLAEAKLHFRTLGTPAGNNAVLILHGSGGTGKQFVSESFSTIFGPGELLDASKYFIILPDGIGHGGSSKPSDGLKLDFPHYGYGDMVTLQYRLVTEGLGLRHLRLVMGTSMGGMQTWMWGERYPEFMDALMPLASEPVQISGRNRFFRRMMIDPLRENPERGLRTALYVLMIMTTSPLQLQKEAPTRDQADKLFYETLAKRTAAANSFDFLYQMEASNDYDPAPLLEKIRAPLLAVNSADDQVNPPELGDMEREIKRVPRGRYVLIPISSETRGHGTHSLPKVWGKYLAELLQESNSQ
ncbi:MAG: alpha/beta fold hydrolase [Acidobacteriota bacterium]|nr:alpha/beta fold hydrolase [Acidobacteriota bacterium]